MANGNKILPVGRGYKPMVGDKVGFYQDEIIFTIIKVYEEDTSRVDVERTEYTCGIETHRNLGVGVFNYYIPKRIFYKVKV